MNVLQINKPGHKYDGHEFMPIGERDHPYLDSGYRMSEAIKAGVKRPVSGLIMGRGHWFEIMATFSAEELVIIAVCPENCADPCCNEGGDPPHWTDEPVY